MRNIKIFHNLQNKGIVREKTILDFHQLAFFDDSYISRNNFNIESDNFRWDFTINCQVFNDIMMCLEIFYKPLCFYIREKKCSLFYHDTMDSLLDYRCSCKSINITLFYTFEKTCTRWVESGVCREMINKDIGINKYLCPIFHIREKQFYA